MSNVPAEHARFQQHLRDLEQVPRDGELGLVRTVLHDPDQNMAVSAVLHHIDRRAGGLDDHEFAIWSTPMAALVEGHDLLIQRIRDWTLLKAINAGQTIDPAALTDAPAALTDATDWLQRMVAETTTAPAVLALLATMGRTRRVRNIANFRTRNE